MYTINEIEIIDDPSIKRFRRNHKDYYVCNICHRVMNRPVRMNDEFWCYKHRNQTRKYGHVLDTNPRTTFDKNLITVVGDIAYVQLYDKNGLPIAQAIIDAEDVEKIRYIKWKRSASNYACNTPRHKSSNIQMSRMILDTDQFVDHINHNTLDNRKANLRVVTKSQNQMNSNYKGVSTRPDGRFYAHIKLHGKMLNLGVYIFEQEALYARWYAEALLFGEYRYPKPEPVLPDTRKTQIKAVVIRKVQRL